MSNTTDKNSIKSMINEVYKTDIEAIRNLSDIANKLQGKGKYKNKEIVLPGNLTIRGNLKINNDLSVDKNLTVTKNSNVKGQTTINQLYGATKGFDGWRTIKVNGDHLAFDIGANKFGFHNNTNGIHYYRSNKVKQLPIYHGANVLGQVNTKNLYVSDMINTRRMDVRNDKGKGTTHFNYSHRGTNYIRGNLQSDNGGIKINGNLNTTGTVTAKYIRGKRGQFGRHGYLVIGEHSGRGFVAARTSGCWYHSGNSSMRKLTPHKSQGNCGFKDYFTV